MRSEMIIRQQKNYTLSVSPRAGIVDSLTLPGDPGNVNLVHRDEQTAFGPLAYTKRSVPPRTRGPTGCSTPNWSPWGCKGSRLRGRPYRRRRGHSSRP